MLSLLFLKHNHKLGVSLDAAAEQDETPLIDALVKASGSVRAPFFFPGHKMGSGAPRRLLRSLGLRRALRHDLPELPELDNLFAPEGPILRMQELAAKAFSAERTWCLANGSTAGVLASVMACVELWRQRTHSAPIETGDARAPIVLLPRNTHKSAYHALVLAGAEPCWLTPEYDPSSGLCLGVAPSTVEAALARCGAVGSSSSSSRVAAVLLVSPTYEGVLSDVPSISSLCKAASVPLIVDEAHGAHLQFLPDAAFELETLGVQSRHPSPTNPTSSSSAAAAEPAQLHRPRGAITEGADLVIQSTHKTLGALTQSAMLHASSACLSPDSGAYPELAGAIGRSLEIVQSSSPSYLLLASLDAARWHVASPHSDGREKLLRAARRAGELRDQLRAQPGQRGWLYQPSPGPGVYALDPLRVTLLTPGGVAEGDQGESVTAGSVTALDGFELDEALIDEGVYAELPQQHTLTFALSAGTSRAHIRRLVRSLRRVAARVEGSADQPAASKDHAASKEHASADGDSLAPILQAAASSLSATGMSTLSTAASDDETERALPPRDAHFSPRRLVAADEAVGLRSAELVCPYPPGIPVLVPGEVISAGALAKLRALQAAGCSMTGCSDEELETLAVLVTPEEHGAP